MKSYFGTKHDSVAGDHAAIGATGVPFIKALAVTKKKNSGAQS
jgi:hypothetical protein